jgi:hypothetical protein
VAQAFLPVLVFQGKKDQHRQECLCHFALGRRYHFIELALCVLRTLDSSSSDGACSIRRESKR